MNSRYSVLKLEKVNEGDGRKDKNKNCTDENLLPFEATAII